MITARLSGSPSEVAFYLSDIGVAYLSDIGVAKCWT